MRIFYYLMFRIYRYAIDRGIERETPLFYVSLVLTVLVGINILTLYFFLSYLNIANDLSEILPNKFYVLIPMCVLWTIIYFGIARPKRFLNYNFKKTKKGGWAVVAYMVFTALTFILVANLNRTKLAEDRLANPVKTEEVEKRPSLEDKIRKWFKDNF